MHILALVLHQERKSTEKMPDAEPIEAILMLMTYQQPNHSSDAWLKPCTTAVIQGTPNGL